MKVLLVEDTKIQLRTLALMVSKMENVEVIEAEDAFEAFAILRNSSKIDYILLDQDLPHSNGFRFLKKLRATPEFKATPVVISTAQDQSVDFIGEGANQILKKPYRMEDLLKSIDRFRN